MLMLAFGLIFLVLFYQNYFAKMKRREAEQLLLVSLESEKNERKRIAADLHDSVSGDLVAIRNYLAILKKSGNTIDAGVFDELREGVENALANTRQVSYKLMPPLLDTFGLTAAIKDYFERLSQTSGAEFAIIGDDLILADEIAYELFRIIQEFTSNMLKYGAVTKCNVNVGQRDDDVKISISDDGKAFSFDRSLAESKGTGLKNISSRLKVIGASMRQTDRVSGNEIIITLKIKPC